jgi:chorismate--pyruvate lyase
MATDSALIEQLVRDAIWVPKDQAASSLNDFWQGWLLDEGSLTKRLIVYSENNFAVKVLNEFKGVALPTERQKLAISDNELSQIREVELLCHNQPIVFARSIIPLTVIQDAQSEISKIGNQPLGHFLFKEGSQCTDDRDIAIINLGEHVIHARRTPYSYKQNEILVSEFFLTDLSKAS